jgi:hypothetical protein
MKRHLTILNDEIDDFFGKKFPLKKNDFKDTNEIFDYFIKTESELKTELMNIISKLKDIPFKTKQYAQYLLNEKLTVAFDQSNLGEKLNKKIYGIYTDVEKEKIDKVKFDAIKNVKNDNEIVSYLTSENIKLNEFFYGKIEKCFDGRKDFPFFIFEKYENLIKDKFLTKASSKGINISRMVYNQQKIDIINLFKKIFIEKKANMFLSKSNNESYKIYLDLVMLCNKTYFENENVKNVFAAHFNYFYYLFNLDVTYKTTEEKKINSILENLYKENVSVTDEENMKKINSILKTIGSDMNNILSIILCLTLIFNGVIIKDISKELIFTSNTQKLITSAKMKVILYNGLIPFEKYLDVYDIIDYCQSTIINSYLPNKDNESYDVRQIKDLLINLDKNPKEVNQKISEISQEIFKPLKVDKKNEILNFFENLKTENKETNVRSINLESLNPKIKSTHCIIFVSGFLSDNDDHIEEWENFALNINKTNICYYYNWPSESINSVTQNSIFKVANFFLKNLTVSQNEEQNVEFKPEEIFVNSSKKAKLCGKILALIIASKIFFEYQTISLIGFSLGTHVISNCIKMLYKINDKIKCDDIIKDVILIAGATSMEHKEEHYAKMFDKIINGKIINCWSNEDQILKELYTFAMKRNPIGYGGKLNLKLDKFKSIDFTPLKLGHTDYRKKMDLVMNKIQLIT